MVSLHRDTGLQGIRQFNKFMSGGVQYLKVSTANKNMDGFIFSCCQSLETLETLETLEDHSQSCVCVVHGEPTGSLLDSQIDINIFIVWESVWAKTGSLCKTRNVVSSQIPPSQQLQLTFRPPFDETSVFKILSCATGFSSFFVLLFFTLQLTCFVAKLTDRSMTQRSFTVICRCTKTWPS